MKKHIYGLILFGIGFYGYGLLEIIWRGYTHISMALTGGVILCILSATDTLTFKLRLLYRALIGGIIITAAELSVGMLVNVYKDYAVWDYSMLPLNYKGQICLLYSVLWCLLCLPVIFVESKIKRRLINT